jgi:DNA-binding transcriptional MerR regulator
MTVRNIRAHQSRSLLPPPELRGRTGYYGPEHVSRLEAIRELQGEGFNLEAIKRLLQSVNGSTEEALRFTRAVRAPFADERPETIGLRELIDLWGGEPDPAALERAVELGFVRPLGDDRFELPSPRLARARRELAALGIPGETALDVLAELRRDAEGVAKAYVQLFLDQVWKPFDEAGRPQERWPEVRDALERLRPLATESLLAVFGLVMGEAIDRALGREIERIRLVAGADEPAAGAHEPAER